MVRLGVLFRRRRKNKSNTKLDGNTANETISVCSVCDLAFLTSELNEYFLILFHKRQVISM